MAEERASFHRRFWGHLTTITRHKLTVQHLCFRLGLYRQGLAHDLSKYSLSEFLPGVRYWQGDRSPIEREKEVCGYSLGWLHHKSHNRHHWEYWMDKKRDHLIFYPIPKKIVKEMVCDRVGACKTYMKNQYTDRAPLDYFLRGTDQYYMNIDTAMLLRKYLSWIAEKGLDQGLRDIKKD